MQAHIKSVQKATWQFYIDAHTEGAVIAEQQRMQKETGSSCIDQDIAFVANLVCRMCPKCNQVWPDDFDGCLALKCGRLQGGAGAGCGAEFCGYCSEAYESEIDVHQHLQTCVWNPRPHSVFPSSDFKLIVWQLRRERVWYYVISNASDKIPSIWDKIGTAYPELSLTHEWLVQRARWLEIASEFQTSTADFATLVPKFTRCVANLQDMGFASEHEEESLLRAAIISKGDPHQAVITLLANQ
jgi:hypothetical protein